MPLLYGKKKLAAIVHQQRGPQAVTQLELVEGSQAKCTQIPSSSQILLLRVGHTHGEELLVVLVFEQCIRGDPCSASCCSASSENFLAKTQYLS